MNLVIYTAIIGNSRDRLAAIPPQLRDVECHAFVSRPEKQRESGDGWQIREPQFPGDERDPRRCARQHKALSHSLFPDADVTIWVDGTMTPLVSPAGLVRQLPPGRYRSLYIQTQRAQLHLPRRRTLCACP